MRTTYPIVTLDVLFSLASALAWPSPTQLTSLEDLDGAVSGNYGGLIKEGHVFPPGPYVFGLRAGYYTFDDGDLAAATNLFAFRPRMGVPVWTVSIIETQAQERAWMYVGADCKIFRTQIVQGGFDPHLWVREAYGDPPVWLSSVSLDSWYAARDRSRMQLELSLVAARDWPLLLAAWREAFTNAPTSGVSTSTLSPDTNRLAFAGVESVASGSVWLWVYTPTNPVPLDVFSCPRLPPPDRHWTLVGSVGADLPVESWSAPVVLGSAFFCVSRGDMDSDGDGVADGREMLMFGTNPLNADSDDDGLSDREETYRYATNPNRDDSDGDDIWDGWEVDYGLNPMDALDAYGDADGDGLKNIQECELETDPHDKDTDHDGIPDNEDKTPTRPGPLISIDSPRDGAVLPSPIITVSGVVECQGVLDSVWIRGEKVLVNNQGTGIYAFTNTLTLEEGLREITVSARRVGSSALESRKSVTVGVDALPPDVTILSPVDFQAFSGGAVRVTVWTDTSNDVVTVNGVATTRDGYIRYAWVRLPSVGTHTIQAVAVDRLNRVGLDVVTVSCTDDTFTDPNDDDNDGFPNGADSDPNDPAVRATVVITYPPNGIVIYAN